jgi:seryl-tRNA synthetase
MMWADRQALIEETKLLLGKVEKETTYRYMRAWEKDMEMHLKEKWLKGVWMQLETVMVQYDKEPWKAREFMIRWASVGSTRRTYVHNVNSFCGVRRAEWPPL